MSNGGQAVADAAVPVNDDDQVFDDEQLALVGSQPADGGGAGADEAAAGIEGPREATRWEGQNSGDWAAHSFKKYDDMWKDHPEIVLAQLHKLFDNVPSTGNADAHKHFTKSYTFRRLTEAQKASMREYWHRSLKPQGKLQLVRAVNNAAVAAAAAPSGRSSSSASSSSSSSAVPCIG